MSILLICTRPGLLLLFAQKGQIGFELVFLEVWEKACDDQAGQRYALQCYGNI